MATAGAMRASPFSARRAPRAGPGAGRRCRPASARRLALAEAGHGDRAAQGRVVRIAHRRRDREAVHAAAGRSPPPACVRRARRRRRRPCGRGSRRRRRGRAPAEPGARRSAVGVRLIGVGTPDTSAGWPGPPRGSRRGGWPWRRAAVSRAPRASSASATGSTSGPALAARPCAQAIRLITASGAHPLGGLLRPALGRGRAERLLAQARSGSGRSCRCSSGATPAARQRRDHELVGRLELAPAGRPGFRRHHQGACDQVEPGRRPDPR